MSSRSLRGASPRRRGAPGCNVQATGRREGGKIFLFEKSSKPQGPPSLREPPLPVPPVPTCSHQPGGAMNDPKHACPGGHGGSPLQGLTTPQMPWRHAHPSRHCAELEHGMPQAAHCPLRHSCPSGHSSQLKHSPTAEQVPARHIRPPSQSADVVHWPGRVDFPDGPGSQANSVRRIAWPTNLRRTRAPTRNIPRFPPGHGPSPKPRD